MHRLFAASDCEIRYATRIVLLRSHSKAFRGTQAILYDASCAVELFAPLTVETAMCIR